MKKIELNSHVKIDLQRLIESRLLVQANSGGGKSWAIRRIIEQSFGKVQIIVIDPEGEFTNLREKFGFVFAGKGGDAPVESRSASLLARRLLELKASTIVDLYELPPQERKHFVRLFCESMVNAPKELWHDCLIIIDEAHIFAPEKGESEAMGPVIDLATRGRKRGYCVVLATQRLPKLNKDAAAECNNKLIGRASQDIDRKRAAEELGFTTKEQVLSLRDLEPGEFYAFGPAISRDVIKTKIGDLQVQPPPRGVSKGILPPAPENIRDILAQLSDIPEEAAKEAQTVADLKAENARLKRDSVRPPSISQNDLRVEAEKLVAKAKVEMEKSFDEEIRRARKSLAGMKRPITEIHRMALDLLEFVSGIEGEQSKIKIVLPEIKLPIKSVTIATAKNTHASLQTNGDLTGPEQKIIDAIAWLHSIAIEEPEQTAVAFLAGYTFGGGGFNNPRGALKTKGFVEYIPSNKIKLTESGHSIANIPTNTLTTQELHEKVLSVLETPHQRILKPLLEAYPNSLTNDELARSSGYVIGSGGFNNPKGRLRSLGLIEYMPGSMVRARDILFV